MAAASRSITNHLLSWTTDYVTTSYEQQCYSNEHELYVSENDTLNKLSVLLTDYDFMTREEIVAQIAQLIYETTKHSSSMKSYSNTAGNPLILFAMFQDTHFKHHIALPLQLWYKSHLFPKLWL